MHLQKLHCLVSGFLFGFSNQNNTKIDIRFWFVLGRIEKASQIESKSKNCKTCSKQGVKKAYTLLL